MDIDYTMEYIEKMRAIKHECLLCRKSFVDRFRVQELCPDCRDYVKDLDRVTNKHPATVAWAYARLFVAIRDLAAEDGALSEWEESWGTAIERYFDLPVNTTQELEYNRLHGATER